jgi:hypothetical protein
MIILQLYDFHFIMTAALTIGVHATSCAPIAGGFVKAV